MMQASGSSPTAISAAMDSSVFWWSSAGILPESDGVQVDSAEQRFVFVLIDDPVPKRAEIVPKMELTCWLYARKDPSHDCPLSCAVC